MNEYATINADRKKRRDTFFCQLAHQFFADVRDEKERWIDVSQTLSEADCSDQEIKHFLDRLVEDGWIEVKDPATASVPSARLTLAGKARAQVICKPGSTS